MKKPAPLGTGFGKLSVLSCATAARSHHHAQCIRLPRTRSPSQSRSWWTWNRPCRFSCRELYTAPARGSNEIAAVGDVGCALAHAGKALFVGDPRSQQRRFDSGERKTGATEANKSARCRAWSVGWVARTTRCPGGAAARGHSAVPAFSGPALKSQQVCVPSCSLREPGQRVVRASPIAETRGGGGGARLRAVLARV